MAAPKIQVTVDIVIFAMKERTLHLLLVQRKYPPFQGDWALPGGFVLESEDLEAAAHRELGEETGVKAQYLEQLYSFGGPRRDPRGPSVTVAYFALLDHCPQPRSAADAQDSRWCPVGSLPKLAFDHRRIVDYAVERLRNKFEYTTASFMLLPAEFTLGELQTVYEAVLDKKLDKRNFRKKIQLLNVIEGTGERKSLGVARPAELFRFSQSKFDKLKDKGILFPF